MSQKYSDLHVKCEICLSGLNRIWISRQILIKVLNIKFHKNPSIWNSADTWEQTDRQTGGREW